MNEQLAKLTRKYAKTFGYRYKVLKKVVKKMSQLDRSNFKAHIEKYL